MSLVPGILAAVAVSTSPNVGTAAADSLMSPVRSQAQALDPFVETELGREFLTGAAGLPPPPARVVHRDSVTGAGYRAADLDSLPSHVRTRIVPRTVEGLTYYQGGYGTILSYLRVFEILGAHGVASFEGKRLLDFGYGRIGHLRAIASQGATAVGVDIDPELRALYGAPGDQGPVPGIGRRGGSVAVVHGYFPGDPATRSAVGDSYDLVISKSTLTGGHEPGQRARQKRVVNLGVPDSVFVQAMFDVLKPGGLFIMYSPAAPKGDARCPFPEAMVRAAGFEILDYDRDDTLGQRVMLRVLRGGRIDRSVAVEDVTALYTVLRRPERAP